MESDLPADTQHIDWDALFPASQQSAVAQRFYAQWHGHPLDSLAALHRSLRAEGKRIVWLAGDSSVDNKHWLFPNEFAKEVDALLDESYTAPATNGYQRVLKPARSVKDVAYWLNDNMEGSQWACINTSVEATTLADRDTRLLDQDLFIRDHIQAQDALIISVGGNDIALAPSVRTIFSVAGLNWFTPMSSIKKDSGWGAGHLGTLFKDKVQNMIERITAKTRPQLVMPCMIYYPSVVGSGWADTLLNTLGYTKSPEKLRAIIDMGFRKFTSTIEVKGSKVVPLHLGTVLDPEDPNDYENRVEPSVQGGFKMASAMWHIIQTEGGAATEEEEANDNHSGG